MYKCGTGNFKNASDSTMNGSYNIGNSDNYFAEFSKSGLKEYVIKYVGLISDFLMYAGENIIIQNDKHYMFVIQRGLETLLHCFRYLFLYTKNIDITIFHCKKAFYYYVEFIGQIGDDSHAYLQLNSKDATLFVYKKTIFEISNAYRKTFVLDPEEKDFMSLISHVITVFHEIIMYILRRELVKMDKKESAIHFSLEKSTKIVEKVLEVKMPVSEHLDTLKTYLCFIQMLQTSQPEVVRYAGICLAFIKKLKKKQITVSHIQGKFFNSRCKTLMGEYTPLRFINWIFSN